MGVDVLELLDLPDPRPMNRDLEEWASEQTATGEGHEDGQLGVAGRDPCKSCARPSEATCLRCGDPMCSRHQRVMYGLCLRCSPDAEADEDEEPSHPDLDIPWIDYPPTAMRPFHTDG